MAVISGVYITAQGPRDGKTVRLFNSGSFASPPQKNTAVPSGHLQSTTTGTSHGGNGHYRFTGVTTGQDYYVAVIDGDTVTYDSFSLVAAGSATGNVKNEGAVGDGVTDDTTAVNTALANTAYGRVFFPPGTYLVTTITINGREGLVVEGEGATIKMSGTGASGTPLGLRIQGTTRDLTIRNLRFQGSGTASDYHAGIWMTSGTHEGIRIENCHFQSLAAGVWFARSSGNWEQILIDHCEFESMVGTGANQGYGVYYANGSSLAQYVAVRDSYFISTNFNATFLSGRMVTIKGCFFQSHRASTATAAVVPAIVLRGRNLMCLENQFITCYDGAIQVKPDSVATVIGVTISGNQIRDPGNAVPDITIGTSDPATDGAVSDLVVSNNQIYKDGIDAAAIDIFTALRAVISGNVVNMLNVATANTPVIELEGGGESAGTATYTNEVTISNNVANVTTSGAGSVNGIRLEDAANFRFCTGASAVRFYGNSFAGAAANFQSVANVSNDNLIIDGMAATGLTFNSTSYPLETATGGLKLLSGVRAQSIRSLTGPLVTSPREQDLILLCDSGGAGVTLTLPAASAGKNLFWAVKTDAANADVTLSPDGADTLNGITGSTFRLSTQYQAVLVVSDGTSAWYVLSAYGLYPLLPWRSTAAATSLDDSDFVLGVDTSAAARTIDLPAAANREGRPVLVYQMAGAANNITVQRAGADTVDGGASVTITATAGFFRFFIPDGTDWKTVMSRL